MFAPALASWRWTRSAGGVPPGGVTPTFMWMARADQAGTYECPSSAAFTAAAIQPRAPERPGGGAAAEVGEWLLGRNSGAPAFRGALAASGGGGGAAGAGLRQAQLKVSSHFSACSLAERFARKWQNQKQVSEPT